MNWNMQVPVLPIAVTFSTLYKSIISYMHVFKAGRNSDSQPPAVYSLSICLFPSSKLQVICLNLPLPLNSGRYGTKYGE